MKNSTTARLLFTVLLTLIHFGSVNALQLCASEDIVDFKKYTVKNADVRNEIDKLIVSPLESKQNIVLNWIVKKPDFSKSVFLNIHLKSKAKSALTVWGQAGNKGSKGAQDRCEGVLKLNPGEEKVLKVKLIWRPKEVDYKKVFEPHFMFFKNMNLRDNTVDPRHITWIKLHYSSYDINDILEIKDITLSGKRKYLQQPDFFPFVDTFGQYKHSDWPGKIYHEENLHNQTIAKEANNLFPDTSASWNQYGGWKNGPKQKSTGFFYAKLVKGKWWLIDPSGHLFWSYGPTGVGFHSSGPITDRSHWFEHLPKKGQNFDEFYQPHSKARFKYFKDRDYESYNFAEANLKRKFGKHWFDKASSDLHTKLKHWGINTIAAWSNSKIYLKQKTPYITMVHFEGPWITKEHHFRMPDPFDKAFPSTVREALKKYSQTKNDPWNIGYCINNELGWGYGKYGHKTAIATLLKCENGKQSAAKNVFAVDLKAKYKSIEKLNATWKSSYSSWEDFLETQFLPKEESAQPDLKNFCAKVAHQYFRFVRAEVKRFAPNHMYLGCRFHGHIDNSLMSIAMEYVDVVSYNIYQNPPNRSYQYKDLMHKKPIMVTEFGVGTDPAKSPWRGKNLSPSPEHRSHLLNKYLTHILKNPQVVGAHFFQFINQPLTGRNDGEALLRGFVDVVGNPSFKLIEVNRSKTFTMYEDRYNVTP